VVSGVILADSGVGFTDSGLTVVVSFAEVTEGIAPVDHWVVKSA
jgi:hypothetical protein